jgi:hypothetical protein
MSYDFPKIIYKNLVGEFKIEPLLPLHPKPSPKNLNLNLCPTLMGLGRNLKFLKMATIFHVCWKESFHFLVIIFVGFYITNLYT